MTCINELNTLKTQLNNKCANDLIQANTSHQNELIQVNTSHQNIQDILNDKIDEINFQVTEKNKELSDLTISNTDYKYKIEDIEKKIATLKEDIKGQKGYIEVLESKNRYVNSLLADCNDTHSTNS